ncbi:MAG: putative oxidoreductase [Halioglobus sp.]|jgi:putative oxidoreductase
MKKFYDLITLSLGKLENLSLLLFRLTLAYCFLEPATKKVTNFMGVVEWFESIPLIFPTLLAFLTTSIEALGVPLLFLGLGCRSISALMSIIMLVAVTIVYGGNGFSASNGGYEINLYYLIMLFYLTVRGAGSYSLDHLIQRKKYLHIAVKS